MTLETTLKRFSWLPHFTQMGNEEPPPSGMKKKIHWVGHKEAVEQKQDTGKNPGGQTPPQKSTKSYRDLSSITLGEVDDAYQYYAPQLLPSPYPTWIATNHFCMLPLTRKRTARPPVIFGRVKVCYPSDGHIQNIQELEIYLPGKDHAPDVVHLRADDILLTPNQPVKSYCMRVRFLVTPEDLADFTEQEALFLQQGLLPEFSTGYIELLEISKRTPRLKAGALSLTRSG